MNAVLKIFGLAGAVMVAMPLARAGDVHWSVGIQLGVPGIQARIVAPAPVVRPPVYCSPPVVAIPRPVVVLPPAGVPPPPVWGLPPFGCAPARVVYVPRPGYWGHHGYAPAMGTPWHRGPYYGNHQGFGGGPGRHH